jgi:hypothetical protein
MDWQAPGEQEKLLWLSSQGSGNRLDKRIGWWHNAALNSGEIRRVNADELCQFAQGKMRCLSVMTDMSTKFHAGDIMIC